MNVDRDMLALDTSAKLIEQCVRATETRTASEYEAGWLED